ncbi:hypothetical protein LCL89_13065 [Halobacillus yeomjeoni]|uniref:hypothetical protein n=1 Tax=Halobacillus yeomjeoni TaxID=311194 RepID=UPI001CD4B4BD|nr:hypothetical protein [Halobacillus yeomjeoni]MCA0984967.1 hypothetical protein [Halobacillus yeomjeoni]
MTDERMMHEQNGYMNPSHGNCNKYKDYHVMVQLKDGSSVDGIIIDVKEDKVTILISEDVMVDENGETSEHRQYGYGGYGGYGRRRRARRFRRRVLPLAALTALALYPYLTPYPYYPYPYPYPYYY